MPQLRYSLRNKIDQLKDVLFNNILPIADLEMMDTT